MVKILTGKIFVVLNEGNNRPPMHANILCNTRYSIVHKLSNKQNAKIICRFDRLSHNYEHWKLIGHPCI